MHSAFKTGSPLVLAFNRSYREAYGQSLTVSSVHVGKSDVKVGDYRAMIDVIAQSGQWQEDRRRAEGRWEDRDTKSPYTAIVADAEGHVIEFLFEGQKISFVITQ